MPFLTTSILTTTGVIVGVSLLRHRISHKWINLKNKSYELTNKTILITGGNVGLGYEAALDFSRRNAATVVIACRNVIKGQEAVDKIVKKTGKNNVECLELDLASLASVTNFLTQVKSTPKYSSIDVLICNAGVWVPPTKSGDSEDATPAYPKTKDGYEIHFGVNHLSHFLIANSLKDQLNQSGDGRIVFVSSSLMKGGNLDMNSKDFVQSGRSSDDGGDKSFRPPTAYCDTKLMNALTCKHMATVLPPTITTYAVCPGFCRSSLGRSVSFPFFKKILVAPIMLMVQRTAFQGAQNIVFTAIEDKEKLQSGSMYKDGEIFKEGMDKMDELGDDLPKELFEFSEELLKK